jgi:hypothetical protein
VKGILKKQEVRDDKTIIEGIRNKLLKFRFLEIEKYRVWKVLSHVSIFCGFGLLGYHSYSNDVYLVLDLGARVGIIIIF